MTFRSRAALIIIGIIIFAILAPAAIFLARGYYFDFSSKQIIKTGSLVIKTDPKGAAVFLNEKLLKSDTPVAKRFLLPREYQVGVKKDGYLDWKKTVQIREQIVTFLPQTNRDKIYLLYKDPASMILSTTTLDIVESAVGIFFISPGRIDTLAPLAANTEMVFTTSTLALNNFQIIDSAKNQRGVPRFLIMQEGAVSYLDAISKRDLPANHKKSQFSNNSNEVFVLTQTQELGKIAPVAEAAGNKNLSLEIMQKNVSAFAFSDKLYYISAGTPTSTPQLIQLNADGQKQILMDNLPVFKNSQIIVSSDRQIFLLLDSVLYQVADILKKINDHVDYVQWKNRMPGLIYGNSHEVWLYPTDRERSVLVTRSAQILGHAQFNAKTGYVFVAEGNEIKAIEIDDSGQPNIYTLSETKNPLPKFVITEEGDRLLYLDGQTLVSLKIR